MPQNYRDYRGRRNLEVVKTRTLVNARESNRSIYRTKFLTKKKNKK